MTIARRRAERDAIVAPAPSAPTPPSPAPGTGAPVPFGDEPAPEAITPVGRLRRCTFRRIDLVAPLPERQELPTYEVMCLYGDRDEPLPLGDLSAARPVCEACTAPGIFRPDED